MLELACRCKFVEPKIYRGKQLKEGLRGKEMLKKKAEEQEAEYVSCDIVTLLKSNISVLTRS